MAFLYLFSTLAIAWFLWTSFSLLRNYQAARKMSLPIILSPLNALNPLWMLTLKSFPGLPRIIQALPLGLGKWARCTYMGWTFHDKYALHDELDLVFMLVTPSGNELWVGDPNTAHHVLSKRKEYHKPTAMYSKFVEWIDTSTLTSPTVEPLDVFGPSLNTVSSFSDHVLQPTELKASRSKETLGNATEGSRRLLSTKRLVLLCGPRQCYNAEICCTTG